VLDEGTIYDQQLTCYVSINTNDLHELYKVEWQSASSPVTVDLKETQTLNT